MTTRRAGQASIEALVLVSLLIVIVKWGFMLFWLLAGRLWLNHQLYQHLVCRAQGHSEMFCNKQLLMEAGKFTPEGGVTNIRTLSRKNNWKGSLNWNTYGLSIPVKQNLRLP